MNALPSAPSPLNNVAVRRTALATTLNRRTQLDSISEIARRATAPRRSRMSHAAPERIVDDVLLEKLWKTHGLTHAQVDRVLQPVTSDLPVEAARGNVQRLQFETVGLCVTLVSIVVTFAVLMLA